MNFDDIPQWLEKKREDNPEYDTFIRSLPEVTEPNRFYDFPQLHYSLNGCTMSVLMLPNYFEFANFEPRPEDVIVTSFPKTGTTFTQEIVYNIVHDLDFEKASKQFLEERFPYLEYFPTKFDVVNKTPNPRLFKSHLPICLLPPKVFEKKCKVIYCMRNPKDTIVSSYHMFRDLKVFGFNGTVDDYAQLFMKDQVIYAPFNDHISDAWNRRNDEKVLFLSYEEMKIDLPTNIRKVAKFLGKNLTDEQVEILAKHCSFDTMSKNSATNYKHWLNSGFVDDKFRFMRKGEIGDWKNHLSEETNAQLDKWIEKRFAKSGVAFIYE